jgi:hypothetical protein
MKLKKIVLVIVLSMIMVSTAFAAYSKKSVRRLPSRRAAVAGHRSVSSHSLAAASRSDFVSRTLQAKPLVGKRFLG